MLNFPDFLDILKKDTFQPFLLLFILSVIWGSSFILMKEGLKTLTGVQVAAFRLTVGGLIFTPFVIRYLKKVASNDVKYVILSGVMGNGIPAFLFAIAQTQVESSVAGALNALTPLFTLLIGFGFGVIVMNTSKVVGVFIGLLGALAIILGRSESAFSIDNSYSILVIIATLFYGANINLIKSKLSHYEPIIISALPLFFIAIPGVLIMLFTDTSAIYQAADNQAFKSIGAIVLLALFGNSISLILFNKLIQISGPVFASSVTYIIPVVATIWGLADSESISVIQFGGLALILAGIYLVNKRVRISG